jgi:hypothetical protein
MITVGSIVIVKEALPERVEGVLVNQEMRAFGRKEAAITSTSRDRLSIDLDNSRYNWCASMFEDTGKTLDQSAAYCVGDEVSLGIGGGGMRGTVIGVLGDNCYNIEYSQGTYIVRAPYVLGKWNNGPSIQWPAPKTEKLSIKF